MPFPLNLLVAGNILHAAQCYAAQGIFEMRKYLLTLLLAKTR
jgi:hypothetical protein